MSEDERSEPLKLTEAATYLIDECRMVLPGIQGLFGFQMIAVFNSGFAEKLTETEQKLHIVAIVFVVLAIALIMTPAAIHRRAEPESVSHKFVRVSSRMVLAAMYLLALAISLDAFVVAAVVWPARAVAVAIAVALLATFVLLWEIYPSIYRRSA